MDAHRLAQLLGIDEDIVNSLDMDNPMFACAGRIHDWRNHVPVQIQTVWDKLSLEVRVVTYMIAREHASNEDWE